MARKLEYRGQRLKGLSLVTSGSVDSVHAVGNLKHLQEAVAARDGHFDGSTGIGHTRWATHGRVTQENAHPHWDTQGRVHIVLNGIVENWTWSSSAASRTTAPSSPRRPTPRLWRT